MSHEDPYDAVKWRLNREISLPDILSLIAAFASVLYAYTTLDKRMAVIEEKMNVQVSRDARQDDESRVYQKRIDDALASINAKLDRLIERR